MARADKFRNLVDCEIADFLDKEEFLIRLTDGDFEDEIAAILHQGACSDTMETDGRYMMRNNYRYSVALVDWCQDNDVPFLYASSASVYGGGSVFREERAFEAPLNIYGYSKFSSTSTCGGCCPSAPRRSPASGTSTCTGRESSTRSAWRRSRGTSSTSIAPRAG